jgi:predicted DNA-binding transcriptional regulator YafY
MPRGGQVARLYALVMELAQSKRGLPVETLARRRGWHVRTVYRDLHALEKAGFPVARTDGGRWKISEGWERRIPFPLPLGQLLALYAARELLLPLRGTPVAREFDALFERIAGSVSADGQRQGELFPRFRSILATRSQLAIDYARHQAVLETLCRAVEERRTVRAAYWVESRGELTHRELDPYCLYYDPQLEALYIFAWCHLRRAMRTFAVHRFRQASVTTRTFQVPPGFTAESYLRTAFRIWRQENAIRVRLRLGRDVAGWVTERRWHASQKVKRLEGGEAEIEFEVDGSQEVRRFVLQLGASVDVIEPEWLREAIAEEHLAAARRLARKRAKSLTPDDTDRLRSSREG